MAFACPTFKGCWTFDQISMNSIKAENGRPIGTKPILVIKAIKVELKPDGQPVLGRAGEGMSNMSTRSESTRGTFETFSWTSCTSDSPVSKSLRSINYRFFYSIFHENRLSIRYRYQSPWAEAPRASKCRLRGWFARSSAVHSK